MNSIKQRALDMVFAYVNKSRFRVGLRELRRDVLWPPMIARHIRDDERMKAIYAHLLQRHWNCVDVGSHTGCFLKMFASLAPCGRHVAFEPLPHLAATLRANFPEVAVHEMALSDTTGSADFNYVPELEGWSGLGLSDYGRDVSIIKLRVLLGVLDDVLPAEYAPQLIKIDVEGAELQMLKGAFRTLSKSHPYLIFEHLVDAYRAFGTNPRDIFDFLVGCLDYRIFTVDGFGPLDCSEFTDLSESRKCWNYIAHR